VKPAAFRYLAPKTIDDALALLARHGGDAKLLAGGQSLVPILNFRLARYGYLIDLNRIAALSYIRPKNGALHLGAMTRQRTIETATLVADGAPLLAEATTWVAHRPIRSRGTIGGSLAHADPAAEYPAVMLALDAQMTVMSRSGARTIPATRFFKGALQTVLEPDELLAEIRLPARRQDQGFAFEEVSRRRGDFAIVGVAAALACRGGTISDARIAVCGLGSGVSRVEAAERMLDGEGATPETIQRAARVAAASLEAQSDLHATSDYRLHLIEVLTRRAVSRAVRHAAGAAHG
jgi:aerobic carbon-monoxide dehydrogenase medium subunit